MVASTVGTGADGTGFATGGALGTGRDRRRLFAIACGALVLSGVVRAAVATRLDAFTIDEAWHITAGVSYVRTG